MLMMAISSCHYGIGHTAERETLSIGVLLTAHSAIIILVCVSSWPSYQYNLLLQQHLTHPEVVPKNAHRDVKQRVLLQSLSS